MQLFEGSNVSCAAPGLILSTLITGGKHTPKQVKSRGPVTLILDRPEQSVQFYDIGPCGPSEVFLQALRIAKNGLPEGWRLYVPETGDAFLTMDVPTTVEDFLFTAPFAAILGSGLNLDDRCAVSLTIVAPELVMAREDLERFMVDLSKRPIRDPYEHVNSWVIEDTKTTLRADLEAFDEFEPAIGLRSAFFRRVVNPIADHERARLAESEPTSTIEAEDWRKACART